MPERTPYKDIEEKNIDRWIQGKSDFREIGEISLSFSLNNPDEKREYALLITDFHYFGQPHQIRLEKRTNRVTIIIPRKTALQMELGPYRKAVGDVLGAEDILSHDVHTQRGPESD